MTTTTNYGWTKPTVGADSDTWGGEINSDLDGIDATVKAVSTVANAALPATGGTMTGALVTKASATGGAGFNCPPGAAPSAPANGDIWTTNSGAFARINGSTVNLGGVSFSGGTLSSELVTVASASGNAGFNLPHGSAPSSPVNGDLWTTSTGMFARINGATKTNAWTDSNSTGTAAGWTTARTITITGDIAYTSTPIDGTGSVTNAATLATVNSNVGSFSRANVTVNAKGLVTAASNGTGFLTTFDTGNFTLSSSTKVLDVAHGLGAIPTLVRAFLIVQPGKSEAGYSAGDAVPLDAFYDGSGSGRGVSCMVNATNVCVSCGAGPAVINKDGLGETLITADGTVWYARVYASVVA